MEKKECGYRCGRVWDEAGDVDGFEDCVSAYHKKSAIDIGYSNFIKNGLAVGFTDDQIDFLWEELKDK